MESLLESIPYSTPLLKIAALVVLALIIKLFLTILKVVLPHLIKQNKIRYHIRDITALVCGVIFMIITTFLSRTVVVFVVKLLEFPWVPTAHRHWPIYFYTDMSQHSSID